MPALKAVFILNIFAIVYTDYNLFIFLRLGIINMAFSEKIEEWIKEVENRPSSALMIMKLVAGRLRDLTERNEELLAENIALQNGSLVEKYRQRISHLEFQLDILKRRVGSEENVLQSGLNNLQGLSLLIYSSEGQILRVELAEKNIVEMSGHLELLPGMNLQGEPPKLLVVSASEELMLLFSSGRVSTFPISSISYQTHFDGLKWSEAVVPDSPKGGEKLVSILPIGEMPVSNYFVQISRKASVKKTMTNISEKIITSKFLGRGVVLKNDQSFELMLANKNEILVLVTYEGRLVCLDIEALSYSAEERVHLSFSDYVVAAYVLHSKENIVCVTQNGKVIQREFSALELSKSSNSRGQALISTQRLEQGVRFAGSVPFTSGTYIAMLESTGRVGFYSVDLMCQSGRLQVNGDCISLALFAYSAGQSKKYES